MRSQSTKVRAALWVTLLVGGVATSADAQQAPDVSSWRLGASTGGFAPRSAVIRSVDGSNTRLGAAPSFSLDLQYLAKRSVAVYANGTMMFSTITLGNSVRPSAAGPSNQVLVAGATGGVVFTIPAAGLLGDHLQPTLRIGGGMKHYSFNMTGATSQWRPTGDFGIGFRGVGSGPLEVSAEVRYLPSSFDQSKLPTRGIAPQEQRQNDIVFGIGISIRP